MFSENNFDESKIDDLEQDILTETLSENLLKKILHKPFPYNR